MTIVDLAFDKIFLKFYLSTDFLMSKRKAPRAGSTVSLKISNVGWAGELVTKFYFRLNISYFYHDNDVINMFFVHRKLFEEVFSKIN
jgi:hypothetical protein